jgi:hypothetical protein
MVHKVQYNVRFGRDQARLTSGDIQRGDMAHDQCEVEDYGPYAVRSVRTDELARA